MKIIFPATLLFLMVIIFLANGKEKEIHPFISDGSYCKKCHENETFKNPDKSCAPYCMTCHNAIAEKHHPVDLRLKKHFEVEVELTDNQRITCRTCHNLKQKRYDSTSWKAESMYERVFHKQSSYKTYFLHIQNTNGELCKKCH